jgi:uncharacterized protein (TIGR02588 family)
MTGPDRMKSSERSGDAPARPRIPALEWIAAAVGLLLIAAMLGILGWEALKGNGKHAPFVEVSVEGVTAAAGGYIVEVALRNRSPSTAAAVEVEGELASGGRTIETSSVTIDYVPGESTRRAGLFFSHDPRDLEVDVRALGYAQP